MYPLRVVCIQVDDSGHSVTLRLAFQTGRCGLLNVWVTIAMVCFTLISLKAIASHVQSDGRVPTSLHEILLYQPLMKVDRFRTTSAMHLHGSYSSSTSQYNVPVT